MLAVWTSNDIFGFYTRYGEMLFTRILFTASSVNILPMWRLTEDWSMSTPDEPSKPQVQSQVLQSLSSLVQFSLLAPQEGVISLYLRGISPTHFASFPHPFASFPQQICFISPTNCFVSPTKCCISPTNCCISPTIFSFPQHNFVSLCQIIKSSKFRYLLIKIRTFAH